MARHYKCKPSDILNIADEYTAYCFDEVAFFLINQATDDKGVLKWNKIKWGNDKKAQKTNKDLIKHMQKYS